MANDEFRPMEVAQILDKTTVVISGGGASKLKVGDTLHILAVGREIPMLRVPLIVPKATVNVTNVAGAYVIARTTTYEVEVDPLGTLKLSIGAALGPRRETVRRELNVNEKELLGNPATSPVTVSDPVVAEGQLPQFIAYLQKPK